MRYGIVLTTGDPRLAAELAAEAEAAGWDGVFTFDAIAIGDDEMYDPWIVLAAIAMRTERVTIGAIVFAPARRRPWKLAREAVSLDILSSGRLVLPAGSARPTTSALAMSANRPRRATGQSGSTRPSPSSTASRPASRSRSRASTIGSGR